MRISTSQLYNLNIASQQKGYSSIVKTQQQVSSGERIQTAGDDPVGAARLMQLGQQQALLSQYNGNLATASNRLSQEEAVLGSVYNVLQHARELTLEAGSGALSDTERGAIADQLEQIEEQLYSLMNSKDVNGQYLFAGSASASQPYVRNPDGSYSFQGNQQSLELQVSGSLSLSTNDSGWDIFDNLSNAGRTTSTMLSAPVRIVPGTSNGVGVSLSTDALIEDGRLPQFQAGAPYTLELVSENEYAIYDKNGNDVTEGDRTYDPTAADGTPIAFRGVQFQLEVHLDAPDDTTSLAGQSFRLGGEPLAFLSQGLVSNDRQYNASFDNGAPYTLQIGSDSDFVILDKSQRDVTAEVTGGGRFETNASGTTSIQFRGVEFQLNLAQLASDDPSLLDGYSFELAAADDRFAVASNSAAQLSSQVTNPDTYARAFPDAGVLIEFGDAGSYNIYLQPYREGQSQPITEGTLDLDPDAGSYSLEYAGARFQLSAAPAPGDSLSIKAESAQNTGILDTIAQLKDALRAPADGDTAATLALNHSLALGLTNLDRGMASVDATRASVGARLNTIDTLTTENESLGIANAAAQSSIRDTDMAEAISRLMLQKTMLEAAQLSFVKVSQLSLFNQM